MDARKSDARGGIPGRLDLVACGLPADADARECSTAETVAARHAHEVALAWHLGAVLRCARRGDLELAVHHLARAEVLVRERPHPVAGHAARVAIGLGGGA